MASHVVPVAGESMRDLLIGKRVSCSAQSVSRYFKWPQGDC